MNQPLTISALARESGVSEKTARLYADLGLIHYERDSSNRRLFPPEAPAQVRALFKRRTRRIRS